MFLFSVLSYFLPFQADLPNLRKTFPLLIFGVVGLAAGILAFWLPETLTAQMPQTVDQAEALDKDYNLYCCKKPQVHGSRGRKEVAKEGEDVTLVWPMTALHDWRGHAIKVLFIFSTACT